MTSPPKVLLSTDIIAAHLRGIDSPSHMRRAAGLFLCYTTVFNAIELFGMFPGDRGRSAVEDALGATKLLGLNARHAPTIASLMGRAGRADCWRVLVAGLCIESRLPLVTAFPARFRRLRGLTVVSADLLRRYDTGEDVLRSAGVRT
jgi:predicted nucleic acid-binding protein